MAGSSGGDREPRVATALRDVPDPAPPLNRGAILLLRTAIAELLIS